MTRRGRQVALVVYPGCSLLELVGAYTMWSTASRMSSLQPVLVGATTDFTASSTPLSFKPQKAFGEANRPDVVMVVGGAGAAVSASRDPAVLDYVREAGRHASIVASTGTGSLILAEAGFLAGRKATTHWQFASHLDAAGAVYQREPWVRDGNVYTGAGSSAAIDLSLLLIARMRNRGLARNVQIGAEWDPAPPFGGIDWEHATDSPGESRPPGGEAASRRVALVIYEGLTVLDLVGPLEVVTALSHLRPEFQPVVVAEKVTPVTSDSGLTFLPNQEFGDVPAPDVVIVPGGGIPTLRAMSNPVIRAYIRETAPTTAYMTSVCTGALLLAGVGLLEGRDATTHWAYHSYLPAFGARYVRQRWIGSERIINSAGVSAGIDMALYLVGQLTDEDTARQVQLALHYDPAPPFGGIDYDHLPAMMTAMRTLVGLTRPGFARRPRRLTKSGM